MVITYGVPLEPLKVPQGAHGVLGTHFEKYFPLGSLLISPGPAVTAGTGSIAPVGFPPRFSGKHSWLQVCLGAISSTGRRLPGGMVSSVHAAEELFRMQWSLLEDHCPRSLKL